MFIAEFDRVRKVDLTTGIINTVAGNNVAGFSGDGGPATKAMLQVQPAGVAVGDAGLFISDTNNQRVRRVVHGIITTVAGNGSFNFGGNHVAALGAQMGLNLPAITTDNAGNTYFSDLDSSRVRKIDTAGIISTVAGNTPLNTFVGGYSGDGGPAA